MNASSCRLLGGGLALPATLGVLLACSPAPAAGQKAGVGWEAFAQAHPTDLSPGTTTTLSLYVMNVGAAPSNGPIVVTDTLPPGVTAVQAGGMPEDGSTVLSPKEEAEEVINGSPRGGARWSCAGTQTVTCTSNPAYLTSLPSGSGQRYRPLERLGIVVRAQGGLAEGPLPNRVTIGGGGAREESAISDTLAVSAAEPGFGFSGWDVWFSNADGTIGTQAGSHPYETTFALGFNELATGGPAGGEARNLEVELPPGFFGEPNAIPRCNRLLLDAEECPANTEIGNDMVFLGERAGGPDSYILLPVYNMEPPQGVADELALKFLGRPTYFDTGPRGYGDHALITHIDNIPALGVVGNIVTLWGVAPEASHDAARLSYGESPEGLICGEKGCPSDAPPRPFLTLPTACGEPQAFAIRALNTWEDEGEHAQAEATTHNALDEAVGFTGCSDLAFKPSLTVTSDTGEADTPAGLNVNLMMPQEALRAPEGLAEATIEATRIALPEGFVINPGQAAGLRACTLEEARLQEAQSQAQKEEPPSCPSASRVGTVKVITPLLEGALESELEGGVYVLAQSGGGPGEPLNLQSTPPTLQLLLAISGDGINLKLVANVAIDEKTGRLRSTVEDIPGVPVTSVKLSFSGGPQAALATPAVCGTYTATSDFTPWTSPFDDDAFPSSTLQILGGPEGDPSCPSSPLPFRPELIAGSTSDQAGGFTSFSLLLQRGDAQQRIEKLQFKAPPGLSGMLSTVSLCPEPQAAEGKCPQDSQIGSAAVASGPGPYSLVIPQPGEPESPIYLTGPYEGAPFGLSIVVHPIAGPFDLEKGTPCDCIVTRAKIEVDPITAQITVTTQPLPQVLDGVPTDLRLINSTIDRPGFMFNPTSCEPSSFSGSAWGAQPPGFDGPSRVASISSRFQVGACAALKFTPTFAASTSAHNTRTEGAALTTTVTYPSAPQGTEANIAKVKVSLPGKLPARLTTLQKACPEATFAANPAACPAAARIGTAITHTPVLPEPLSGPAYFVSHGGAKYPELVIVLQGDNVTIDLHGETSISKKGVLTSAFNTVPDAPFSSFQLTLPEGPYSALTANGANLCKGTLSMPTELVAQDGAPLTRTTKLKVTGCPKRPKRKHARHKATPRPGRRR